MEGKDGTQMYRDTMEAGGWLAISGSQPGQSMAKPFPQGGVSWYNHRGCIWLREHDGNLQWSGYMGITVHSET